jgi:hypothetical protein
MHGSNPVPRGWIRHPPNFEFQLRVLDPKSGIVLWAFTESNPQSGNKTKSQGYFAQTLGTLVDDLRNLTNRNLTNQ